MKPVSVEAKIRDFLLTEIPAAKKIQTLGPDDSLFELGLLDSMAVIKTVETEKLAPQVLLGKQIFYNSADNRMAKDGYLACARRELAEESGLELADGAELVAFSHWITPEEVPVRFDTRFYLALAPAHSKPHPDGVETVAAAWWEPAAALGGSGDTSLAAKAAAACGFDDSRRESSAG